MAFQDLPLSDLDSASSIGNSDLLYVVQSGESKKTTAQTLLGNKADLSAGKLILAQFPNTSKEVLNDTARYALTTNDVRNGFIVIVDQPTEKMYLVVDETHLDSASGYKAFAADANWNTIQNKPNNLVVYETTGNVSTLKSEGGTALNPKTTTEALVDENGVSCADRIAYGEESASVTVQPPSPYLHESDIVNDLTTSDATKPLSAAMGYTLNSNLAKKLFEKTYSTTTQTWQTILNDFYTNTADIISALSNENLNRLKLRSGNLVFTLAYVGSGAYHFTASSVSGSGINMYGMVLGTTSYYVNEAMTNTLSFTNYSGNAIGSARTLQLYLA